MTNARRITIAVAAALGALALLALPSVAAAKDRNHDRIPDRWEKRHRLSLEVNQARRDQDRDGLRNRAEFLAGDNPRQADSDGDGVPDSEENAGTIQSFDAGSGKLVISLFGGETLSGLVTAETEIKCERELADEDSVAMRHGEGEQGDDNDGNDEEGANCASADLVAGAVVEEAELELEHGVATFEEVELAG